MKAIHSTFTTKVATHLTKNGTKKMAGTHQRTIKGASIDFTRKLRGPLDLLLDFNWVLYKEKKGETWG